MYALLHISCVTDWLTDWLTGRLTDWLTDWLADWLTGWLADWLADWLTNWLTGWLTDWLTDWLAGWLTDWLTNSLAVGSAGWVMGLIMKQFRSGYMITICFFKINFNIIFHGLLFLSSVYHSLEFFLDLFFPHSDCMQTLMCPLWYKFTTSNDCSNRVTSNVLNFVLICCVHIFSLAVYV
jgi:uncharacterized membrane protein